MSDQLQNICLDFHAHRRFCEGDIARVLLWQCSRSQTWHLSVPTYLYRLSGSQTRYFHLSGSQYKDWQPFSVYSRDSQPKVAMTLVNPSSSTDCAAQFLVCCTSQHLEMVLDAFCIHPVPLLRRECTSLPTFSWRVWLTSPIIFRYYYACAWPFCVIQAYSAGRVDGAWLHLMCLVYT